ncbi:NmrA family protein [Kockovaella imperatae]|uniref:NmrA family protein n=1 Tax=Kockovaella imperatae TaxID=4999 RepID=A0A1Y1URN0_9TREE|nr:NmrA family protein [Kockovaella imperatae]ORX40629.1 NmrA family protein [Kockovaella imperatae]
MTQSLLFLVLGATGGTGKHFVTQCLRDGHRVRALVRTPSKLPSEAADKIEVVQGSITDNVDTDALVKGVDYVVAMLGDKETQQTRKVCLEFVQKLVPSMRENGVKRFLFQAGGLSRPYGGSLTPLLWFLRYTLAYAGGFHGQHLDNEAVMEYLSTQAMDIEWIVHRAGIGSDGPSKGKLARSPSTFSIGTHVDCATYSFDLVQDASAVHTSDFSHYV